MALRFQADYFDVKGQKWRVEIHDSNFSGTASDIRLSGEGFVTKWEGSEETLYSGIMPSSTTLEVINEGGDMDVFLSQVANMDEGDVRIDLLSYEHNLTTGTGTLWWSGILLIDGIQQEDAPTPSIVSFTATDDLAHLKTQRWTFDDPDGYDGGSTAGIAYIIHRCLWECRNRHAFGDNDIFYTSVQDIICEGYDESYFGSPGLDQFSLSRFNFSIGTSPNEFNPVDGQPARWFMWDILQSIAITFNLRIFFARGHWRVWPVAFHYMQADNYDYTDRVYGYQKDGDQYQLNIGSAPQFQTDLRPGFYIPAFNAAHGANSENEGIIKLGGGIKTHSTPVKYVKRQQDWRGSTGIASESILYSGVSNTHVLNDMGDVVRMDFTDGRTFFAGAAFTWGGNVNIGRPSSSYPGTNNTLIARLEVEWDCGDYRWHGSDGWTTDQTGSHVITIGQDSFTNGGVSIIDQVSIDTTSDPLPADSDSMSLTATLKLLNGYGGDITESLITGSYNSPQTTCISVLQCHFAEESDGSELHFIAETSRNNKVSMDQGSVLIGSVQGASGVGHIEGTTGISGANWRDDNHWESYRQDDADLDIHRLGVNEIAGTHEVGREIESGDLQLEPWLLPLTPLVTLVSWDGVGTSTQDLDYWAPLTMSYNCASRTANVSRMRLDWDGGLDNISVASGNLPDGSFNPDQTETDGSIPGTPFNPPVLPMPQSKGFGSNQPFGGTPNTNIGGKLSAVMDKTNAIEVDPGNGITSITIKAGSTAFDADKVSQGTTNKFATSTQLGKVDNLTITAATDLDTMRSDVAANNAKEGITQERADKLDAISYANGAISGFSFGSNTNVINAEAIETDVDRQFISASQATDISNSKTKTDLISVYNGQISDMTLANGAISYEKIETDQDHQFIGEQLKLTIGTDSTARLVTNLITTTGAGSARKITSITTTDGEMDVNNARNLEQAVTITEVMGTKYVTAIQASGSSVLNTSQISENGSTKQFTTSAQRRHLGHLTSDSNGITSIATGSGTSLDTEDARQKMGFLTKDSNGITSFTTGGGGGTNVNLYHVHNALLPANNTCANTGVYAGTCSAIDRARHLPDTSTDRSGQTGQHVVTIDEDGDFQEVSDGTKGQFMKTSGTGVLSWAVPPYVLASHSARMSLYYTNRYYYGSTSFGWSTESSWSSSQTSRTSIADDYAHAGIVAPTAISTLKLIGTIRNDSNAGNVRAWLLKASRPDGASATTLSLTDLGDQEVTIGVADRHYNIDITAANCGISAGDLVYVFFQRTQFANGSTFVNTSWTLHATP